MNFMTALVYTHVFFTYYIFKGKWPSGDLVNCMGTHLEELPGGMI